MPLLLTLPNKIGVEKGIAPRRYFNYAACGRAACVRIIDLRSDISSWELVRIEDAVGSCRACSLGPRPCRASEDRHLHSQLPVVVVRVRAAVARCNALLLDTMFCSVMLPPLF
jgi:hypothetical protein